jgi:4-hydroxy-tetrahydrodipicolinate synthase
MPSFEHLPGVYAAAITQLSPTGQFLPDDLPPFLAFLARRGCHGALILGTTGEGPSFSIAERLEIYRAATGVRQEYPDFRLLAGTGTPSLEDTIGLTRAVFELDYDGVVVLPPYFYRKATLEGLYQWYAQVMRGAVPRGGALLGYHIPAVSGVPLPFELLRRLKDAFPEQFAGLKDSTGDAQHASKLGEEFGDELLVFTGNDTLISHALNHHASGCITALANLASPEARQVWESWRAGAGQAGGGVQAQERLIYQRKVLDRYPPTPAMLKALLRRKYGFPEWTVRLPLLAHDSTTVDQAWHEIDDFPAAIADL